MDADDLDRIDSNIRSFIGQPSSHIGLHAHQHEALLCISDFLALPKRASFTIGGVQDVVATGTKKGDFAEIVAATGTGKTRIIGALAKAANVPTLILTPRNLLASQARREFCDEIGIPEDKVAVYDSKQSVTERKRVTEGRPPPQFVITTYQSLSALLTRHELNITDRQDRHYRPLVILDEVHEAQGEQTLKRIEELKDKVLLIGLTATDNGASARLFNGQKPIFNLPIRHAIKTGLLCKGVRTGVIDVTLDKNWTEDFVRTPAGQDYSRENVERFARAPSVLQAAIRFHLNTHDPELGTISRLQTIFYVQGVAAAREGADEFNRQAKAQGIAGIRACAVSGDMPASQCQQILDDFRQGKITALWNDRLLIMGFDAQNAAMGYSLQPTQREAKAKQMLGRIVRQEGPDYHSNYGQHKIAWFIDVRPKGTYPYLAAQALGEPELYSTAYGPTARNEPIGKAQKRVHMSMPDVQIHTDYEDMRKVLADSIRGQDEAQGLTPDWLTETQMAARIGQPEAKVATLYRLMMHAYLTAKNNDRAEFSMHGSKIRTQDAKIVEKDGRKLFCLHAEIVAQFDGLMPENKANYLSLPEIASRLKQPPETLHHTFGQFRAAYLKAMEARESHFDLGFGRVNTDQCTMAEEGDSNEEFRVSRHLLGMLGQMHSPNKETAFVNKVSAADPGRVAPDFIDRAILAEYARAKSVRRLSFTVFGTEIDTDCISSRTQGADITSVPPEIKQRVIWSLQQTPRHAYSAGEVTLETNYNYMLVKKRFETIQKHWEEAILNGAPTFSVGDITIPVSEAQLHMGDGQPAFYLSAKAFLQCSRPIAEYMKAGETDPHFYLASATYGKLAARCGLKPGFLSQQDMETRTGLDKGALDSAFLQLYKAAHFCGDTFSFDGAVVKRDFVEFYPRPGSNCALMPAVDENLTDLILEHHYRKLNNFFNENYKARGSKNSDASEFNVIRLDPTEDWFNHTDMANRIGANSALLRKICHRLINLGTRKEFLEIRDATEKLPDALIQEEVLGRHYSWDHPLNLQESMAGYVKDACEAMKQTSMKARNNGKIYVFESNPSQKRFNFIQMAEHIGADPEAVKIVYEHMEKVARSNNRQYFLKIRDDLNQFPNAWISSEILRGAYNSRKNPFMINGALSDYLKETCDALRSGVVWVRQDTSVPRLGRDTSWLKADDMAERTGLDPVRLQEFYTMLHQKYRQAILQNLPAMELGDIKIDVMAARPYDTNGVLGFSLNGALCDYVKNACDPHKKQGEQQELPSHLERLQNRDTQTRRGNAR